MSSADKVKQQCYDLGKGMPNGVSHEDLMQLLVKIIVKEKIHDDDAFALASRAYAEGFNGLKLGSTDPGYDPTQIYK
ncbi:unnamed protein product [marine sediment metagenome]|uniref:Uncharacterized protein n=1 Tax=marine sediment metagenome TaxID=412755 RepID=X1BA41_9ZZZZ